MGLGAAYDLVHNSDADAVTLADVDLNRACAVLATLNNPKLKATHIDASDSASVVALMRGHDAVISCVTYHHNLRLARAAVEARANFCDLGGNNAVVDQELALDGEAAAAGINIIPDCGLAPGMVSILAAHGASRFDTVDEIHLRVGGLPQNPKPPLDYQIIFSVEGLINEYVERARVIRNGVSAEVDSMTELEKLEFPAPFGQMEAFQTSGGTSTLPESFLGRVKDLDYKTIRYPGHCEKFKAMIDLGLASATEIDVDDARVAPRRVLAELLTRHLPSDDPDVVLVRAEFVGMIDGKKRTLSLDIIDYFDEKTGMSAMMRMTAFPASIIAQMMARGETTVKGAVPQERCIPTEQFVAALGERNIRIIERLA